MPRFSNTTSIDPSSSPGCISDFVLVFFGILDESTNFSVSNHAKQAHWRMPLEYQQNLQKTVSVLSGENFSLDYRALRPCRHRLQKFSETYCIDVIFSTIAYRSSQPSGVSMRVCLKFEIQNLSNRQYDDVLLSHEPFL